MMAVAVRSGGLASCLSAVSSAVPSATRPIIPAFVQKAQKLVIQPSQETHNSHTLASQIPQGTIRTRALTGFSTVSQARFAHTDLQFPDFSAYRRDAVKDPNKSSEPSDGARKSFSYLMVAGGTLGAVYSTKVLVQQFVMSMNASADVLALAKIEIKLSEIPEGKNATFKWRNKPLFVRHRTAEEIDREQAVDIGSLRDAQHDIERCPKPEWLILLGICTHLGCVPVAGMGEYGGYYCPCHGSHYDASGRIRKGPAPLNLEIPEHTFVTDDLLVVG